MTIIQFDLAGGARVDLPADIVAQRLIERLQDQSKTILASRPRIGEYLHGQGGIYVGDILGSDGVLYGLVTGTEMDIGRAKWGPDGERDLSDWDGLSNTKRLRNESPAAKLASDYERDGHADFYLPARRELLIAAANVPHLFGKDGWYATSTPCGSGSAWVVDFEDGSVYVGGRLDEFRVRPFRSIIHSSL